MRKRKTRGYEYKRPREVVLLSACLKSFVFSTLFDLIDNFEKSFRSISTNLNAIDAINFRSKLDALSQTRLCVFIVKKTTMIFSSKIDEISEFNVEKVSESSIENVSKSKIDEISEFNIEKYYNSLQAHLEPH